MKVERRRGLPAFERGPRRKPKVTVVIWCEGESEQGYLAELVAVLGKSSKVELNPHGAGSHPSNLFKAANRDPASRAADYVWLVFDDDKRDDFWQTVLKAKTKGYNVAWTSMCFEYWLLLHHAYTTAADHTAEQVEKRLCQHHPDFAKGLANVDWQDYVSKRALAVANAVRVAAWQAENQRAYPPGTTMHELVSWLERL